MGATLVQAGDGGSAAQYSFDSDGLSNDPRLSFPLQSLTYAQLQTALDGGDPLPGLMSSLQSEISGAGLPCGTVASGDPNCTGGAPLSAFGLGGILPSIPTWAWIAGIGTLGALLLIPRR